MTWSIEHLLLPSMMKQVLLYTMEQILLLSLPEVAMMIACHVKIEILVWQLPYYIME